MALKGEPRKSAKEKIKHKEQAEAAHTERVNFYRRNHGLTMHEAVEAVEMYDKMMQEKVN